jgi:hypothetical protein
VIVLYWPQVAHSGSLRAVSDYYRALSPGIDRRSPLLPHLACLMLGRLVASPRRGLEPRSVLADRLKSVGG